MTVPYALKINKAFNELIVEQGMVPTAVVAAPVAPGATQVTVTDPTAAQRFLPGTPFDWFDGVDDTKSVVLRVTGVTITLDPGLGPLPGQAHAAGAVIATNVYRTYVDPSTSAEHFSNGFPVIATYVLDDTDKWKANLQWGASCITTITHHLPAVQANAGDGTATHPQIKLEEDTDRAEVTMNTLKDLIKNNSTLRMDGVAAVFDVTGITTSRRHIIDMASNLAVEELRLEVLLETLRQTVAQP